jgi:alpha/beta superfamily hydrolase
MVLKGQFLERATLIQVGRRTLEGLWHRGHQAPAVLMLSPLPGSGSMEVVALNELAFALSRAGHPTLRFNYGGVGASPASKTRSSASNPDLNERVREARAALEHLRESAGFNEATALAYRDGAEVALALADSVQTLVLVAPPATLDLERVRLSQAPTLFVIGQDDRSRANWGNHCAQTGDQLEVIQNADELFNRGLPQLGHAVSEFLKTPRI